MKKVKIKYNFRENSIKNKIKKYKYDYDEETTFFDLKLFLGLNKDELIIIKTFNKIEGEKYYFDTFDYILSNSDVKWNATIDSVKISDYINTFDVKEINVENVIGGIGDASFLAEISIIIESLEEIFKFLWNNREVIEYGFMWYEIIKKIMKKIIKKSEENKVVIQTQPYLFSILIRDDWHLEEFIEIFEIEEKYAKCILELLGYKYISRKKCYHLTKKRREKTVAAIITIDNKIQNNSLINSAKG